MKTSTQRVGTDPVAAKSVTVFGGIEIVFRAVGEDTKGVYSVFEITFPPGLGPPPHVHTREDESWYVLSGSFDIQIGDETFQATPGWFGLGPRDIPHGITPTGTGPSKMLMIVNPAGFERFFEELAEATPKPPFDFERIRAVFGKHGMKILDGK